MRTLARYRSQIGIIALCGFLAITSVRTLIQTIRFNPNVLASQHVAPLEMALDPIDDQLPEGKIIGYLGEYTRLYYAMQYSLAPHVVRMIGPTPADLYQQTTAAELAVLEHIPAVVIVYNADDPTLQATTQRLGLIEVQDLDDSMALFCRADAIATVDCPFRGRQ